MHFSAEQSLYKINHILALHYNKKKAFLHAVLCGVAQNVRDLYNK